MTIRSFRAEKELFFKLCRINALPGFKKAKTALLLFAYAVCCSKTNTVLRATTKEVYATRSFWDDIIRLRRSSCFLEFIDAYYQI